LIVKIYIFMMFHLIAITLIFYYSVWRQRHEHENIN
jgi:preprotein translocase subunit YajC